MFLSHDPTIHADTLLDVGTRIAGCGATVFFAETCLHSDVPSHVLAALAFADEVLILVAPIPGLPLPTQPPSDAYLSRRFLSFSVGAALARDIPLGVMLLGGIREAEFVVDPRVPEFLKKTSRYKTIHEYESRLLRGVPGATRGRWGRLPPSGCVVSVVAAGATGSASAPAKSADALVKRLAPIGVTACKWTPGSAAPSHGSDAVVAVVGSGACLSRVTSAEVAWIQDFASMGKPVAVLRVSAAPAPDHVLSRLGLSAATAQLIDYDPSDPLCLLQLIWAIVGYRPYEVRRELGSGFDVFVCHSSNDKALVELLVRSLSNAGVRCWVDYEQIVPGDRISERIEDGLRRSRNMLVCVSRDLGKSGWCHAEYGSAIHAACSSANLGTIFVGMLDDCPIDKIPLLLRDIARTHLSSQQEVDGLVRVLIQSRQP